LAVLSTVAAVRLAIGGRRHAAAAVLGLGTLVKLYPATLLLLLLDGSGVAPLATFALVVVAGYAPFAHLGLGALGSLPQYVTTEFFNPGLVRTLIDSPATTMLALGAWVVLVPLLTRGAPFVARVIVLVGGIIVASPNIFPWYVLPLVPFLAVRPSAAWIGFTGTVAFAYTFFLGQPWAIPVWAMVVERLALADVERVCRSIPLRSVNLGVGENGLHPHYRAILDYLWSLDVKTTITSNGRSIAILSDAEVKRFHSVEFSLDFPTEHEHDLVRGTGNWRTVMVSLERCAVLGVATTVTAVMMNTNHRRLGELARVAARVGCHLRVNVYQPSKVDRFTLSRSEEHTSELQSRSDLVCRLLLEKKKKKIGHI